MSSPPSFSTTDLTTLKQRTCIYVVCSPQSHVGTTLTARLLLDFLLGQTASAGGFDTNHLDPRLAAVFPGAVQVIDLASTRGQMTLFDSLIEDDKTPKVVDLWHVSYERFFHQAVELGFFDEAHLRGLKCFLLLVLDPKERFVPELSSLPRRCPGADIVLVQNEGLASPGAAAALDRLGQRALFIPKFDDLTRQLLEKPEILTCRFVGMVVPDDLRALQQGLRESLTSVFEQFELLEVASELRLPARSLLRRRNRSSP